MILDILTGNHTFPVGEALDLLTVTADEDKHSNQENRWPEYDTKLYLVVRFHFWSSGECEVPLSLQLLSGPLWTGEVISMIQTDMSRNLLYCIRLPDII